MLSRILVHQLMYSVQIAKRDIYSTIDREMSGDLEKGFKTVGTSPQVFGRVRC